MSCGQPGYQQTACQPVANPDPYIDTTGVAGVERYLARSIFMAGLVLENTSKPYSWHGKPEVPCPNPNAPGNAKIRYCPSQYEKDITMLADLNAGLIMAAAGRWGDEASFSTKPGNASNYLAAARQTIEDINAAYNCRSQRHPIIQASVFEFISGNPVDGSQLEDVYIPVEVITAFDSEIIDSVERSRYFSKDNIPKTNVEFNFKRTAYHYWGAMYSPDYEKLEGRMWMYFLAKTYIDMGYTSLHMGQPRIWAKLDYYNANNNRVKVHEMLNLMNTGMEKIRNYAASKGSFVVMMAEAAAKYGEYYFPGAKNYYYGTDADYASPASRKLIFDYKLTALRAMEIVDNKQIAEDKGSCTSLVKNTYLMFEDTPCAGLKNAVIEPCNGYGIGEESSYQPDAGGITHLNQTYSQSPTQIAFDYSDGFITDVNTNTYYPWGQYVAGQSSTWGYDDAYWFTTELSGSPSCQAYWLDSQIDAARLISESKSFLAVPGWLPAYNGETNGNRTAPIYPDFYLSNSPQALAIIRNKWDVSVAPIIAIFSDTTAGNKIGFDFLNRRKIAKMFPSIILAVTNPRVSSVYTWHIQRPDSIWEAFAYGSLQKFKPTMAGTYSIELRQDDLGLPAASDGSRKYCKYVVIEFIQDKTQNIFSKTAVFHSKRKKYKMTVL